MSFNFMATVTISSDFGVQENNPEEAASCGPAGTVLGTRVPAEQRAAASRRDAAPLPFQRPPWGAWWEPAPASLGLGETLKMTSGSLVCKDLGTRYHGRH